jgi:ribosomal protein S18 acetylase RimI-like enzyme
MMIIRSATSMDYMVVKKLYNEFKQEQDGSDSSEMEYEYLDGEEPWEEMLKNKHCTTLIADDEGTVVGFLTVRRNIFNPFKKAGKLSEIDLLVVEKEVRRRGIGKQLVNEAFKHLKSRGYKIILLIVRVGNPARYFWHKMGFREVSKSDLELSDGRRESIVYMLKDLV